jgi:glucosamine kinase
MTETYSPPLVIGIDAGGTRSRACLARSGPGGAVLGRGSGGPGNALSVERADLTRHLTQAVAGALAEAGADGGGAEGGGPHGDVRARVRAVFGGFAGAAEGIGPERGHDLAASCLSAALLANGIRGAVVGVGGDTEVALAAAPGAPLDGLVLIAGTGAIATRLTGGRRSAVADGHGWLLGDGGSGFWLGVRAVRAALEALDGRGPWTSLVARVTAHYLGPAADRPEAGWGFSRRWKLEEAIVTSAYGQPPAHLAGLSRYVVEAASGGDTVAAALLDRAADLLAFSVRALGPRAGEVLVMTGGLLGPRGPLVERVTSQVAPLGLALHTVADGAPGAAALAARLLP